MPVRKTGRPRVSAETAEMARRVGARLAAARREARLSQVDLAHELGAAQSRIAKLELGHRRLLYSEAIVLARLIGVPLEAFDPDHDA